MKAEAPGDASPRRLYARLMPQMIPLKDQEFIQQKFAAELVGPVKIDYFTTREMLQELASLSDLISLRVHIFEEAAEERSKLEIERIPGTILRGASTALSANDGAAFKYYGM